MTLSNERHGCSRDQVLVAHANEMITRTGFKSPKFAHRLNRMVVEALGAQAHDRKVPDLESIAGGDGAEFLKQADTWLKRVQRWLDGSVDFPAWLEEPWVLALEPEYRDRCTNELAARHGLVAVRQQSGDACPVMAFGQLVGHLGSTVEACGVVLADGKIDARDHQHLPQMIESLLAAESRCAELRRVAENVIADIRREKQLKAV